jgi:hypothetical protein
MQHRFIRLASVLVAFATLVGVLIPLGYLLLFFRPSFFTKIVNAPIQYELNPVSFYLCIGVMFFCCALLIIALILSSIRTILCYPRSSRCLFYSLLAVSCYLGGIGILKHVPVWHRVLGVSSTITNLGFMVLCWSGLPIWGPALLWWSGSSKGDYFPPSSG